MIKNVLTHIDGIGLYGVLSICIFFAFFAGMLLWAFARNKSYLDKMSALPLDGGEKQSKDNIQPDQL